MTIIRDTINFMAECFMWGGFIGLVMCLAATAIVGDTSWLTR